MPHVVVEGPVRLAEIGERFAEILDRDGDDVVKIRTVYLEPGGEEALFEALVVESGHRQQFFIQLRVREGRGATVRLLPLTDPEKTPGVKRAIARVAGWVRDLRPDECRFGATNIGELLGG